MNSITEKIRTYWSYNVDSIGLDVFRISYCLVLLFEVLQFFYFKELILDRVPFLDSSNLTLKVLLLFWIVVLVLMTLGLFTKISAILNYAFSYLFFSETRDFSYHMLYTYLTINFFLIFVPIGHNLSLPGRLKTKKGIETVKVTKVPVFFYHSLLFWGIGAVYFDSVFRKLTSPMWSSGLGLWLPASLPHIINLELDFLLNQETIVKILGYTTIIFEAIFIFVFFVKKFRVPVFIIGVGLHLGILLAFPIPLFALGACGIYLLLVPFSFWRRFVPYGNQVKSVLNLQYTRSKNYLLLFMILVFFIPQFYITSQVGLAKKLTPDIFLDTTRNEIALVLRKLGSFTGVVPHGVFMDSHFREYNHVVALIAEVDDHHIWLPIVDSKGIPSYYNNGSNWVNWTFRVNSPKINMKRLSKGIIRYSIFWAQKNSIDMNNMKILVKVKKIEIPSKWQMSYLNKQIQREWLNAGQLTFSNNSPKLNLINIEEI